MLLYQVGDSFCHLKWALTGAGALHGIFFLRAAYDSVEPQPGGAPLRNFATVLLPWRVEAEIASHSFPKMQSCSCSDPSPRRRRRADESAGEPAESASCTAAFHLDHGDQLLAWAGGRRQSVLNRAGRSSAICSLAVIHSRGGARRSPLGCVMDRPW